jgi:hypothetical protein
MRGRRRARRSRVKRPRQVKSLRSFNDTRQFRSISTARQSQSGGETSSFTKINFATLHSSIIMGQSSSLPSAVTSSSCKLDPDASVIVDGGNLLPQSGIYKKSDQDYSQKLVKALIKERKLSPFYAGLEEPGNGIASQSTTGGPSNISSSSSSSNNASSITALIECPICFLYHRISNILLIYPSFKHQFHALLLPSNLY